MMRCGRRVRKGTVAAIVALAIVGGPAAGQARAAAGPDWESVSREAIDLLRRYLRIASVNPPADTREAAAFLEGLLKAEGIEVRRYESTPGKVNLLARLAASAQARRPGARPILLLHHMDVVPVDAARWPVDPFGAEMKDGFIYGRGAADMKGVGIIHLLALLTLKRQSAPLSRDILLMATADEETGGHGGARYMIQHLGKDLDPEYVLDEGGFGARDVLAADGRLVFAISVAEKKMLWVKLAASGTAGHGSQPTADNANDLLTETLASILERSRALPPRAGPVVKELTSRVGALADNKFTRALQRDTVSLTTLQSGVGVPPKVNVIPSAAEATLDCRLLPDTDIDRFLKDMLGTRAGEARLRAEVLYRMDDTPVTLHDTPMFAALEKAIRAEHPEAVVAPMLIPYGTDSNAFRVAGAKAYGLIPMALDASIIASMHSDAEKVPAGELGRGVRIIYNALRDVSQ